MTPNDAWDRFVGWQSPAEFMELSGIPATYDGAYRASLRYVTDAWGDWERSDPDQALPPLDDIVALLCQHIRNQLQLTQEG